MASSMPIPAPPRTPTPPPEDDPQGTTENTRYVMAGEPLYDPQSLSPADPYARFAPISLNTDNLGTVSAGSSIYSPSYPDSSRSDVQNPFNFETVSMSKGNTVTKSNIGQRRGHRYKHSSVSHQIFLEPPPRAPLTLPNSLPIPTFAECRASMTLEQKTRLWWSLCHISVAGYAMWSAGGSSAMEALSHLLVYDSLSALVCVIMDVLSKFDVWKRSTLRHPFGLERMEVLCGFCLSIFLVFTGFDLISHGLRHALEGIGHDHDESHDHHSHSHQLPSSGSIAVTAILALASTLISAIGLKNHARIGKAMRFSPIESLPTLLSNPSHFLTLSYSTILLVLPLLSLHGYTWMDKFLSNGMAVCMCVLGGRLAKTLGSMLLMSYSEPGVPEVLRAIRADPAVTEIEDAKFWQVHYGLAMANLRLRVEGNEDTWLRLRERFTSLIRNRLGGGYGGGGQKWEVSIQLVAEGHSHHHHHPDR